MFSKMRTIKNESHPKKSLDIDSHGIATQRGIVDLQEINNREIRVNYAKKYKFSPNLETNLLTGSNDYQLGGKDESGFTIIKGNASSSVNSGGIKLEWIARGELVELTEHQRDINDGLPSKPPELLQHIKWLWQNRTRYWFVIVVAVILVIAYIIFQAYVNSFFSEKPSENNSSKENTVPALHVTFVGGNNPLKK